MSQPPRLDRESASNHPDDRLIAQCPRCHRRYRVPATEKGSLARCRCGNTFKIEPFFELNEPIPTDGSAPSPIPTASTSGPSIPPQPAVQRSHSSDRSPHTDSAPYASGVKQRRAYRLGLTLSLLGLWAPFLLVMPLLYSEWFSDEPAAMLYVRMASSAIWFGIILSVAGTAVWARGKGRSAWWCLVGVAWIFGLLTIYLLDDRARPVRLAAGDAEELDPQLRLDAEYADLGPSRQHRWHALCLYLGMFGWLVVILWGAPGFLRGFSPVIAMIGLLLTLIMSPFILLIPIITLWRVGIYLPPRLGDRTLRSWGTWRLVAMVAGFVLWLVFVSASLLPVGEARRMDSGPPQSPQAVAHAVGGAMVERWDGMASPGRNTEVQKQLEWVEVVGYDPETRSWVGRLKSSGHGGANLREFTARIQGANVDLDLYTDSSPLHRLRSAGEFVNSGARVQYK